MAAAAALAVGVPATATAQTWNHADPAGDVTKYSYNEDTDEESSAVDPSSSNGDVISSTIKHNPRKVIATVRFRDLAITADDANIVQLSLRTNKLNRDLTVFSADGLERGMRDLSRPRGGTVRCRGLSHRIDYAAHTVTMVVPRSCLGHPRWVKASAIAGRLPGFSDDMTRASGAAEAARIATAVKAARAAATPDPAVYELFFDDAHSTGAADGDFSSTFSPRLRRG